MPTTPEEILPSVIDTDADTEDLPQVIDVAPPEEVSPELVSDDRRQQLDELMQPARLDPPDPPAELVAAVVRYFIVQRAELLNKVADIEQLLGFIREDGASLAVRVAKLEAFCGLKG